MTCFAIGLGFESVRGRILPFSYLHAVAVLTQCWRYRAARDRKEKKKEKSSEKN